MERERRFRRWLRRVADIAFSSEWCIEESGAYWREWFDEGLSANDAVARLFRLVREGK